MSDIFTVTISSKAMKQLKKLPKHIVGKLQIWVDAVQSEGLNQVRKTPGFHDEPLLGKRKGQRSIRLNRSYRAIYKTVTTDTISVEILEVNNHEY